MIGKLNLPKPFNWSAERGQLMKGFLAGVAAALVSIGLGAFIVVEGGFFDTSASRPHDAVIAWVTHTTFLRSTARRAKAIPAPSPFTQAQVVEGFHQYRQDCEMCHGGPGVPRAPWVSGMTPTPPFLLGMGRTWSPAQLYLIVSGGAKMTSMPAWSVSRSPRQIWNVVAFVYAFSHMSASDYARMRAADEASQVPVAGSQSRPVSSDARSHRP